MIRYCSALLVGVGLLVLPLIAVAQTPAPAAHDPSRWHAPGPGHEHGDPPPAWLTEFLKSRPDLWPYWGDDVLYAGPFSTSAAENTLKHVGMKGTHLAYPTFHDRDGGWLDGYLVEHTMSNPMDRGARFHSARLYIADAGGGASFRLGWVDFGDPSSARAPKRCSLSTGGPDCADFNPTQRPIVFFIDQATLDGTYRNGLKDGEEFWYGSSPALSASIAWGINATTLYSAGETAADTDPAKWHATGAHGQVREVEVIGGKLGFSGAFFTTQFGEYIPSPADPRCSGPTVCLLQYVSPTYRGIDGRQNVQFPDAPGWTLPN